MIYDGFDFSQVLRCNPARRVMAPVEVGSLDVPGMDGAIPARARLSPASISVSARVLPRVGWHVGFSDFRRMLASWLFRREPAPLVLDDDPGVSYMAVMADAPELSGWWEGSTVELSFTAYDPVGYGRTVSVPLPEGASSVLVGGTYPTWPVFRVSARAGASVRVADADSGLYVQVPAAAGSAAREVVVDCSPRSRRAVTSGVQSAVTLGSRFYPLEPGVRHLTVEGGAATLEYAERWL